MRSGHGGREPRGWGWPAVLGCFALALAGCAAGGDRPVSVADVSVSEDGGVEDSPIDAFDAREALDATGVREVPDAPDVPDALDARDVPPVETRWTLSPLNEIVIEACAGLPGITSLQATLAPNGSDPGFATPEVPVAPGSPCIVIPGMVAGASNTIHLAGFGADGSVVDLGVRTYEAPPLPDDLPVVTATGTSTIKGWIAMPLAQKFGSAGGLAVIVDPKRGGRIVWYHRMGAVSDFGLLFRPLGRGRFAEYRGPTDGIDIIDIRGKVLETWKDIPGWEFVDGHLGVFLDDGSAILNGHHGRCETVGHVSADRQVVFEYQTYCAGPGTAAWLTAHPNWAVLRPDGDLMVSLRNESAVDLYSGTDGTRIWRFGGEGSDFTLEGTDQTFSTQHGATLTSEGTFLVFDNGTDRNPPASRVLEYRLDEVAFTATFVREIDLADRAYTPVGGSARRLSDGNTLVGGFFSVFEADRSGVPVWTLEARTPDGEPFFSYLASPMDEVH